MKKVISEAEMSWVEREGDPQFVNYPGTFAEYVVKELTGANGFTIEIEVGNTDGTVWQAAAPPDRVNLRAFGPDWTAEDVARTTADNQNVIDPHEGRWRIRVWAGADADTSTEPAFVLDGQAWRDEQADIADRADDGRYV